ncbi:MAG: DUF4286 family protein [Prevotellaceae bacterium]|jgi:hypothetical protein|nr:DUF4286 family protein [Prevotellaceae bacterium]
MIVFNTTYLVSLDVHDAWLQWISFRHIPSMLDTSFFIEHRLFKVLVDEEQGITYSLQFSSPDMATIEEWQKKHRAETEADLRETFGESVMSFSTLLEEIK